MGIVAAIGPRGYPECALNSAELRKIVAAIGSGDVLDDTCGACVSMMSAS